MIVEFGCVLIRHGGRHDWYRNPTTGCPSRSLEAARSRTIWLDTSSPCSATRRIRPPEATGMLPPRERRRRLEHAHVEWIAAVARRALPVHHDVLDLDVQEVAPGVLDLPLVAPEL